MFPTVDGLQPMILSHSSNSCVCRVSNVMSSKCVLFVLIKNEIEVSDSEIGCILYPTYIMS